VKVYIAGPVTHGDQEANVRAALAAADLVLAAGHWPYVPHLSWYWHRVSPKDYEVWMALDEVWLRACDAILRVPGSSPGADREVALAESLGLPLVTVEDGPDGESRLVEWGRPLANGAVSLATPGSA
jgi:hypothetical protein